MANRWYNQFVRTPHNYRVDLDCNFVVDSANGNGLGVRSLKGPGIAQVYMYTSATPAVGNPNPAAGNILVKLQDNFQRYYSGTAGFVSYISGTPIVVTAAGAHLVVGTAYIITLVGTTTTAEWNTLGVPVGIDPAVGLSFIAKATGAGAGSGVVEVPKSGGSGIDHIELIGDPNLSIKSSGANVLGSDNGPYILMQCLSAGSLTAPVDGTVIGLTMSFSNSMIKVQGE